GLRVSHGYQGSDDLCGHDPYHGPENRTQDTFLNTLLGNDTSRPGGILRVMTHSFKGFVTKVIETLANRTARRIIDRASFAGGVAYRIALEMLLHGAIANKMPNELFAGISDDFWFWLNTEGCRKNPALRSMLPAMPDENVQLMFTGAKGDAVLREGFAAYRLFKALYENHVGPIAQCHNILDFGCGWGRIIRFFLKDIEPSRLWGCDPVENMINICKNNNKWCNFTNINTRPPGPFQDDTF